MEEDLKFQGKPILLVVKPQGTMLNDDALDIIFEWGSTHSLSGNPKLTYLLRNGNAYLLAQKWKWFWHEAKKTNLHGIQVKGDRYIFSGAENSLRQWIKIKGTIYTIRRADAIIDYYHLGKEDPKIVPRFWIGIEGKRQKKHSENLDCDCSASSKVERKSAPERRL
ncbi:hypothetical protein JHK87_054698 [Glycine soja]|nr:hypothetical protein JHK87_054698 [Glycine soja]